MSINNHHIYEQAVIRDELYLRVVEAAMMQVALEVYGEESGHPNRRSIALAMFLNTSESARYARFYAWLAIFNPTVRAQVFHGPDDIRPEAIVGEDLRTVIRNAWDVAANVEPDSEGDE